jgi:hypothetical protein
VTVKYPPRPSKDRSKESSSSSSSGDKFHSVEYDKSELGRVLTHAWAITVHKVWQAIECHFQLLFMLDCGLQLQAASTACRIQACKSTDNYVTCGASTGSKHSLFNPPVAINLPHACRFTSCCMQTQGGEFPEVIMPLESSMGHLLLHNSVSNHPTNCCRVSLHILLHAGSRRGVSCGGDAARKFHGRVLAEAAAAVHGC